MLKYAIKTGRMTRQPCEACGAPDVEAHHEDYSKPLDMQWMCRVCHGELHRGMTLAGRYVTLSDGTPDRIELAGCVESPEGYAVYRRIPSITGWITVCKRVKSTT